MGAKAIVFWLLMITHQLSQGVDAFCCETIEDYRYGYGSRSRCYVSFATIDPCLCVVPTRNTEVYQFNVAFQKKVTALPVDFDNRFPNLELYNASSCSIQSISKENFEDMKNLRYLYLDNNQIETIARETFSLLTSSIMIHLQNNRITFIDAEAFQPLKGLIQVLLKQNECINRNFCGKRQIKIMAGELGKHCKEEHSKAENLTEIGIL